MLINPILTTFHHLADLLPQIDGKLKEYAIAELNYIRYGIKDNISLEVIEDLLLYKDIIKAQLFGCNCLGEEDDRITGAVKRLLNKY